VGLETESESELNRSWPTNLEQGTQSYPLAAQAGGQCSSCSTELSARYAVFGKAKVWMIEEIKGFRSELEMHTFSEIKLAA
jgi:hypothetical protein